MFRKAVSQPSFQARGLNALTLSFFISSVGILIFAYKVFWLGFPLRPNNATQFWSYEARVTFQARNDAVSARLFIPKPTSAIQVFDENFISRAYGLTTGNDGANRTATWTIRKAVGKQTLFYRALLRQAGSSEPLKSPKIPEITALGFEGADLVAAESIVEELQAKSADAASLVSVLLSAMRGGAINGGGNAGNIALLLGAATTTLKRSQVFVDLLALAGVPARIVRGVQLREQPRNAEILDLVEVFIGGERLLYDVMTGEQLLLTNVITLWRGAEPLINVSGASNAQVHVSVAQFQESDLQTTMDKYKSLHPLLYDFSLFSLPLQTQAMFRILLLVPLGALVVVLLRNVIGLQTFGTFSPVLIALAFRETHLFTGLLLFCLIVGLGLVARAAMAQLHLLLIPRLAAILTVVILMMLVVALVGHKYGLEYGLSIAVFPMVILTMTIERMSIVWEERGRRDALWEAGGTLLSAILAYLIMMQRLVSHLVFVFPELLLVLLAVLMLLGRYTGYRLLELKRFRLLASNPSA